ncbi:MAG: response regulator [Patescibacteria group bacterium]|nr:response regulator [Patescibacteria group bacterium]
MKKTILIIEDDEYLAELYRFKFSQGPYTILEARNGRDGADIAKKEKPDLILLDIVMPVLDGYETLKLLREDKETKNLKIYILSNLGQADEIQHAINDGADGYFIKANMTPNQLLNEVDEILKN